MRARCYPNQETKRWYARSSCQAPNPDESHWCGLYGWYSPDRIDNVRDLQIRRSALGVIEAWGSVLMGDQGFRAERARIIALAFVPEGRAARICRRRGIAVYQSDEDLIAEWPPDRVDEIREVATVTEIQALEASTFRLFARMGYERRKHSLESIALYRGYLREYDARLARIEQFGEGFKGERVMIEESRSTWQRYLDRELERYAEDERKVG